MIEGLFLNNNYVASKRMLDATQMRQEAIAANLANVERPGYKRVDLPKDFSKQFAAQVRAGEAQKIKMPSVVQDADATSQRRDGNNVEIDKELIHMNENTLQYETLTDFVSSSLKQLRVAITGKSL